MQRFKNSVGFGLQIPPCSRRANARIGALVDAGTAKLPADRSSKEDRFYIAAEYRNAVERGSLGIYSAAELADGKSAENGNLYKVHDQGEGGGGDKRPDDRQERQRRHGDPGHGERRSNQNVEA